ncbi:MAG TPA: polysaccharide biosynthesis/export family protein [Gemmataceae bacterium]|nr:polysaccharide biosynthesis/export family protein [Gemmataceae bacterium]
MAGKLGNLWQRNLLLWALVVAPFLPGCSTGAGGTRFTLFPQRSTLLDSAKELRQAAGGTVLALPRELDEHVLAPYTVAPGDELLVRLAEVNANVQLPGDQPVLLDGTISLGRFGQVVVAGKTVREIEALVQATLQARVKDAGAVVVQIVGRQSKVYYVLGEVNAPGAFQLQGREKVLDGIIAAGGLTDRASRKNIILSRPTAPDSCRVVLPICYREIVQLGDTTTNYQLAPGDRIYVSSRGMWEEMFHKKDCLCGAPQTACPLPAAHCPMSEPAHGAALEPMYGAALGPAQPTPTTPLAIPETPLAMPETSKLPESLPPVKTGWE